tara:strand:- start:186 stop:1889 length:1704 start_codon:yes stop_codon:yes gene_type:complete
MNEEIRTRITTALKSLYNAKSEILNVHIEINRTTEKVHGDLYTNIAMKLAKILKKNPCEIAEDIKDHIPLDDHIIKIESVAPGYINFFLSKKNKYDQIDKILNCKNDFIDKEKDKKNIHVEYVSANPTGPLHIGHGRGMILGEITARFLAYQGHKIKREYYVNDAGRQIDLLLVSVLLSHIGESAHVFIDEKENEDGHMLTYKGNYISNVASSLSNALSKIDKKSIISLLNEPIDTLIRYLKERNDYLQVRKLLVDEVIDSYIRKDLEAVGINFDSWYNESELYKNGILDGVFKSIENKNLSYTKDGALWFKNTQFGDDKDRVLIKTNGDMTYFATDIAYHVHKFKHHDVLIDIWGADHHDYAQRLQTALRALGYNVESRLQIHLVQFANLSKSGQSISMSTRSGKFYPVQDLVNEIGKDATRFFYLIKRKEQHLDFDIDQAGQENKNNPIYYIQYAHARITKILQDLNDREISEENYNNLNTKSEIEILDIFDRYQETINKAIYEIRPDLITNYLYKLSKVFHSYYAETKILTENVKGEKIKLLKCIDKIILDGLEMLDITPLDSM